ncbi:MAG: TRAP transporter small permease subunit [Cypionkella sp.]|nr:TRAP transporter small permease subunit [Cypionkella sp.]
MNRLLDGLDWAIGWLTAAILGLCFSLLIFSVFARYVAVGMQVDWIIEVVVFLTVWAVLLGVARVERRAGHIRVDFLLDHFSARMRTRAEVFGLLAALAVSVFFVYAGLQVVQDAIRWDERTESTLRIPMWMYYAALSVSFSVHSLFILQRLYGIFTGTRADTSPDLTD